MCRSLTYRLSLGKTARGGNSRGIISGLVQQNNSQEEEKKAGERIGWRGWSDRGKFSPQLPVKADLMWKGLSGTAVDIWQMFFLLLGEERRGESFTQTAQAFVIEKNTLYTSIELCLHHKLFFHCISSAFFYFIYFYIQLCVLVVIYMNIWSCPLVKRVHRLFVQQVVMTRSYIMLLSGNSFIMTRPREGEVKCGHAL